MFAEILKEAFPIIQKVAPTVAAILGNPVAGAATSSALNLLAAIFNINKCDIQDLAPAIVNDSQAEDKLASVEKIICDMCKS